MNVMSISFKIPYLFYKLKQRVLHIINIRLNKTNCSFTEWISINWEMLLDSLMHANEGVSRNIGTCMIVQPINAH